LHIIIKYRGEEDINKINILTATESLD